MHVLIIGKVWPEPASSAAGSRMLQLMAGFRRKGWQVSFASAANRSEFTYDLALFDVHACSIELNRASFDHFVKQLQPNIVLFDRFTTEEQFGWRVAEQCPQAMRVLDTEDLHCLRAARHQALKEKREFAPGDLLNDIARRELASIYRCDLSLIISLHELELLSSFFKVSPALLHYTPFLNEAVTEEQIKTLPAYSARKNFISIGNFLHAPNWDAVLFLKQAVWPLIRRQLAGTAMEVYGAYPSHKVFQLHNPAEGFLIKGRAEDVEQVMTRARVCLAPLRFGAGLKGKLLDAMRYGTPSVTTAIGAEGMHQQLSWSGMIEETPERFAEAAIRLYEDEEIWHQAQVQGFKLHNQLFEKTEHTTHLINAAERIYNSLDAHRLENFTGFMLMHQSLAATKYMALWIEAKNKTIQP